MTETIGQEITVESHKYDGSSHRSWQANVIEKQGPLIILDGRFAEEVSHPILGKIARGTISIEYYWLDRWYSIFRFQEPSGELRNYYCNINMPPTFDGHTLTFVDLDMDILVAPDLSYKILDEDEFELNTARFNYPMEVKTKAHMALNDLVALIESKQFPFDYAG